MSCDYDKHQWQAEQAARDSAIEKQREKDRKARERAARNARRKLERLHRALSEAGEISDFEDAFGTSVLERLEEFGAAFHDLEKGRPSDALSFAQKSVISAMNKKVKSLKKAPDNRPATKPRSSFKPKKSPKFTPRVRQIEDDYKEDNFENKPDLKKETPPPDYYTIAPELKDRVPYLPEYKSELAKARFETTKSKKPFLRLVK